MNENGNGIIFFNDSFFNGKNENIVEYIGRDLQNNGYKNIRKINCGSWFLNKNINVEVILNNNFTLNEIKSTQILGTKFARRNIFAKMYIPAPVLKNNTFTSNINDKRICDIIKNTKNIAIILSSAANELMLQAWVDPLSYLLGIFKEKLGIPSDTVKRGKYLLENKEIFTTIVAEKLQENIERILGINPNAKIIILGLYKPNKLPESYSLLINMMNEKLKKLAKKYQQSFVDISQDKEINKNIFRRLVEKFNLDFHPKNPEETVFPAISKEILKRFKQDKNSVKVPAFLYKNTGLEGAINDIKKYKRDELEYVRNLIFDLENKGIDPTFLDDFVVNRLNEAEEYKIVYENSKELLDKRINSSAF